MRGILRQVSLTVIGLLGICGISLLIYGGHVEKRQRHQKTASDIRGLKIQLEIYKAMNGFYPTTAQGLKAFVTMPITSPTPIRWFQAYTEITKDAWQNTYIYRAPGTKNPQGYDLFSAGPDRTPDTVDDDWG